ncbi:Integral membrane protein [Pediococcus damnosus]|uniref:Integral membrane protein n=2 Tax=Pediococcus damnosus TaxID=51663 RepID=A0A143AF21_9LACO|nr:DUF1304 domain-containing protein [Pediococcus damnosus]AMV60264.1 Integral membrane protein [Pediococcus damnosus]AMV62790.1 Integral membrane protein [Pediococcus damnosus]AMV64514.1 Integral membrane protein [Pediococcus damnosus]AMV67324.1 Integral membrane protein [Pediococcus damnosus]AMV69629.1 Integral membrane protein [Pediococcus damnosus]
MTTFTLILAALIGFEHLTIMLLEMFAGPHTQSQAFDMPFDFVKQPNTRIALANQGIYNGALGLLIISTLFFFSGTTLLTIMRLLMLFVMIVGAYGGLTVTKKIFGLQLLPATIVFILLFL